MEVVEDFNPERKDLFFGLSLGSVADGGGG